MSTTDQPVNVFENNPKDQEPVLILLAEISASLKDLNLTFKDHVSRLERLGKHLPKEQDISHEEVERSENGKDNTPKLQEGHEVECIDDAKDDIP